MKLIFEYLESVDSTNNEIKRRLSTGIEGGHVISAGEQTGGRGRRGHDWKSPSGESVATSMVMYPEGLSDDVLPRITIICAVAVSKALEDLYDLKIMIKWPNDILIEGKKLCGILTERVILDAYTAVIVGIGVNVHQRSFPEGIAQMATSLDLALSGRSDMGRGEDAPYPSQQNITTHRGDVIKAIWERFSPMYEDFVRDGGALDGILSDYNDRLISKGQIVRVLDPAGEYEGRCVMMDREGRLLIESDGGLACVDSGEVSVRGIYGYV